MTLESIVLYNMKRNTQCIALLASFPPNKTSQVTLLWSLLMNETYIASAKPNLTVSKPMGDRERCKRAKLESDYREDGVYAAATARPSDSSQSDWHLVASFQRSHHLYNRSRWIPPSTNLPPHSIGHLPMRRQCFLLVELKYLAHSSNFRFLVGCRK